MDDETRAALQAVQANQLDLMGQLMGMNLLLSLFIQRTVRRDIDPLASLEVLKGLAESSLEMAKAPAAGGANAEAHARLTRVMQDQVRRTLSEIERSLKGGKA